MKLRGISVLPDISAVFVANEEFTVIHPRFCHTKHFCDFGSFPAAHGIFQHFLFFVRQAHRFPKRVRFIPFENFVSNISILSTTRIVFAFFGHQAKEHRTVNICKFKIKLAEVNGERKIVA